MNDQPLVAVVGATGAGKSALAVHLAERWNGEIVSADSRALYRGMDIGTAKAGPDLRVRVAHHLVDVADPFAPWSLAEYRAAATDAIRRIHARGRLPFLVGGTGQYVTAVLEGWSPPPRSPGQGLREALEKEAIQEGAAHLHRRLESLDPISAHNVDPRNVRRVIRLLEIAEVTGRAPSAVRKAEPAPYRILRLGLTLARPELYARLDNRLEGMMSSGLIEEVRNLMSLGLTSEHPVLSAIGYVQIAQHLEGRYDLGEALRRIRQANRQLVRRQANWFKPSDPRIQWLDAGEGAAEEASRIISEWTKAFAAL
ncbi:MAG: tRNA (adenosine(37)-N6)-dimethylallyltransferase MiaA [Anaerolineales bacterium]